MTKEEERRQRKRASQKKYSAKRVKTPEWMERKRKYQIEYRKTYKLSREQKDRWNEYQNKYRRSHPTPEKTLKTRRDYVKRPDVRERIRARGRTEKYLKRKRDYSKTEKGRVVTLNILHKRRLGFIDSDIGNDWLLALRVNTTICVVCGNILESHSKYPDGKHLDHIVPINIGGKHMMNNVRYICAKCNLERPKDGSDLCP